MLPAVVSGNAGDKKNEVDAIKLCRILQELLIHLGLTHDHFLLAGSS